MKGISVSIVDCEKKNFTIFFKRRNGFWNKRFSLVICFLFFFWVHSLADISERAPRGFLDYSEQIFITFRSARVCYLHVCVDYVKLKAYAWILI